MENILYSKTREYARAIIEIYQTEFVVPINIRGNYTATDNINIFN